MKRWIAILMMIAVSFTACNKNSIPQDTLPVEQVIDSKEYIFLAETANPPGGNAIRLSYGYDLVVKPGEIIATLPYYGRAYTADRNFAGMRFNSTAFKYNATVNDKGAWEIVIIPADVPDIIELRMNVSADGYATLYITSNNRQPISYYGRIQRS